jgi:hypothetical protein
MSRYLGRGLILTPMIFSYKGKSVTAPVIIDTGAEGFATLDRPFAEKLGIPLTLAGITYGVGGSVLAWHGRLDSMRLKDIPACSLNRLTVNVSDIPLIRNSAVALLGLDFMGAAKMTIKFEPGKAVIQCPGGPPVAIPATKLSPPKPMENDEMEDDEVLYLASAVGAFAVMAFMLYISYLAPIRRG